MTRDAETVDFPLERCPNCGYSLEGLPRGHVCPECGVATPADVLVLFGWGVSGSAGWAAQRSLWTAVPWVLFFSIGLMPSFVRLVRYDALLASAAFAAYVGVTVWLFVRVRTGSSEQGGVLQVRLSQNGFGARLGVGRVKVKPWTRAGRIAVMRNDAGRLELTVHSRKRLGLEMPPQVRVQFDRVPLDESDLERTLNAWHDRARLRHSSACD